MDGVRNHTRKERFMAETVVIDFIECENFENCENYAIAPALYCCEVCMTSSGVDHTQPCAKANNLLKEKIKKFEEIEKLEEDE